MKKKSALYRDESGRFSKGNPGKPMGATDRTRRARLTAFSFVDRYFSSGQAAADWEGLEPGQRWNVISRLLGMLIPKEQKIDLGSLAAGDVDTLAFAMADLLEENTVGDEEE